MADLQVTCVNKPDRNSPHEAITHLGGSWGKKTRLQIVNEITGNVNSYYTLVNGKRANVGVYPKENPSYVRTYADGYWSDNLLALSDCS